MSDDKRSVGRPLKFESVEILQTQIDKYFEETPEKRRTITGLALALDTDRQTLINYEKRDQYFDTIKRAKLRVENAYELSLRDKGKIGDIFALKNFGWQDKIITENKNLNTDISIDLDDEDEESDETDNQGA